MIWCTFCCEQCSISTAVLICRGVVRVSRPSSPTFCLHGISTFIDWHTERSVLLTILYVHRHTHTQRSVLLITLILMHWLLYNWVYWRVFITFRNPYYRTIDIRQCRFSLVSTLLRPFNSCTSLVTKAWLYPHVQLDSFGAQENSGWICFLMPAQHMWVAVGRVLQSLMSWGWMSCESA